MPDRVLPKRRLERSRLRDPPPHTPPDTGVGFSHSEHLPAFKASVAPEEPGRICMETIHFSKFFDRALKSHLPQYNPNLTNNPSSLEPMSKSHVCGVLPCSE
jgi:hypothetical protein